MNYIVELNMFDDWVETESLSANAVLLWRTLMAVANRSGWKPEFTVSLSTLESRTKLHKSTICRARDELEQAGLLDYESRGGRLSAAYRLYSFELRYATQGENRTDFELQGATQSATRTENDDPVASHTATQGENRTDVELHSATLTANINKPNIDISSDKEDINNGGSGEKKKAAKSSKKKKADFDLSFIGDDAWENLVRIWLDYKQSRNESYKSELSVKKFHTMLRNLSRGDPALAGKIIDKSIANNWAGIFELTDKGGKAAGQRIGQIKQPEDEERRRKLLDKFGRSGDTGKK